LRTIPIIAILACAALLAYFVLSAEHSAPLAQQQLPQQQQLAQNGPQPQQQPQPQAPAAPLPNVPSDDVLLLLIRASLIALNQANVTGNYSVLRDLAAPSFKEANSPDKLAQIFANMRQRKLDLSSVLLIQPKLYRHAEVTPKGNLRITGFFPTESERINFDLMFQPVEGRWRLLGISANAVRPQQAFPAQATPQVAPAQPSNEAASAKPSQSEKTKPAEAGGTATKSPSSTEVDVRNRLDNPPSPPSEDEEPKEKSFWNPFAR
jgi:hypothetical protein